MTALIRRDPLRSLRLLFLVSMLCVSALALVQAATSHAGWDVMVVVVGVLAALLLLRADEFVRGRLVPFPVDLLELIAVGAMLVKLGQSDPVLGPVYFLLLFRAATGSLRRLIPMIAGYIVVCLAGSLIAGIPLVIGVFFGMPLVSLVVYGMRTLLLRLREEQRRHTQMIDDVLTRLPFPVLAADASGGVVLANPAASALTGPLDELRATRADGTPVDLPRLAAGESGLELRLVRGDGKVAQVVAETVPAAHGTIVALLDVTAQRGYEEKLEHAAFHDPLTGLPNRALLWRRFAVAADGPYAVLLVDLDGFKAINDTYGHLAGDDLLCRIAERLRHVCGADATVARLGGDEFAALLPASGRERAEAVAAAVHQALAWEIPLATGPVRVGASVGFALGGPGLSPDDVLAEADAAMYLQKHARLSGR
ncbi:diguanylate cyclase domain-containing protein [Paractinoplanes globisporus]|uniref:Diguanylate cyclase domain-containing protein n=1 Tax=Paractinoplanes globisporus TaxID=113565 RepID=A0ABW6WNW8_9ACTN|nr:diguanylate cyclase [Actinoplanes globisporus]